MEETFSAKHFLASLTTACGIYQMFDRENKLLYVGKARNLKQRVSSYFRKNLFNARLTSLVKQIHHIEVMVTRSENEALLLENQLIKSRHPRYNILLRDDKSFPYIVLTHHGYPRLINQRGERQVKGQHYGPYPSVTAVREATKLVQATFKLRTCRDNYFINRVRPCLLYQIKKCSAPCVNHISQADYQESVQHAKLLLSGKNVEVIQQLINKMEMAAQQEDYENAALLRDQITHLRHIQQQQSVTTAQGDADVFVIVTQAEFTAAEVLTVRDGRMIANQTFYPKLPVDCGIAEILAAFIPQYYIERAVPAEVVIAQPVPEQLWLVEALAQLRQKKVKITVALRGEKHQWLKMAERTALQALASKIATASHYQQRLNALQNFLALPTLPKRMECFDISHSSGEATVASCVVFNDAGALKSAYRKFNINDITPGDDYAAIAQAVKRRYQRIKVGEEPLPDILFIDGGKGQLHQAEQVLTELNIPPFCVIAIAKGPSRKPGMEQLFIPGQNEPLVITADSPALHLIQQIRDEAHRFALHGHQRRRDKTRRVSLLENIPGIGKKRRQALLQHLGGWQEVRKATVEELQRAPGISQAIAETIYTFLRKN